MRVTVHIPDNLETMVKTAARNEGKSVSSLMAEAVKYYVREKKRRDCGIKVLELIGKARLTPTIMQDIENERKHGDRA